MTLYFSSNLFALLCLHLTSWTMSVSATLLHDLLQVIKLDTLVPPPPFLLISTFQDSLVFGTVSITINYIIFDLQCHLLYTEFVQEHRLPLPPDNKILPDT